METAQENGDDGKAGIGRRVGGAIGGVFDFAFGTVGQVGSALGAVFRLPGRGHHYSRSMIPGTAPGIEYAQDVHTPPPVGEVQIRCIDYSAEAITTIEVDDIQEFLGRPRPEQSSVRWLKVDGLHPYVVNQIRSALGFHTLAAEDVMSVPQRPRVDNYEDHLFVIAQLFVREGRRLASQQVSMFFRSDLVVTFHERLDTVWDPIFARLERTGSNIRQNDGSYLAYALLDTLVDHGFPVLESYAERLEELEDEVMSNPRKEVLHQVHAVKRELALLQRVLWPTRELTALLSRADQTMVNERVRAYLRDVNDHCAQLIDMLDTFRELASSLAELHLSMINNRMGEVMHLLTLLSSVFIPATFIAGVYGMNFERLPELHWQHGYEMFWLMCIASSGGMLWYFRRKGWLGRV